MSPGGGRLSTPFLYAFASDLVAALEDADLVEITGGRSADVAGFVAGRLGRGTFGDQLVPAVVDALTACPDVVELYADDDALKEVIEGLGANGRPTRLD